MLATSFLLFALAAAPPARAAHRSAPPPVSADSAAVLAAHRAWWRAFTVGDTARLASLSSSRLSLTMSTGRTLDRAAALADARQRGDSSGVRLAWGEETAQVWGEAAVVTSRFTESVGATDLGYRFISVLRREAGVWRVTAAQSTRLPAPPVRVAVPADALREYAGRYRTPQGRALSLEPRDSTLVLVTPDGGEDRLVPIGPAIFESPASQARFAFERDASGRVVGLTLLSSRGVFRWPRLP